VYRTKEGHNKNHTTGFCHGKNQFENTTLSKKRKRRKAKDNRKLGERTDVTEKEREV
jgi:hypothetical protein